MDKVYIEVQRDRQLALRRTGWSASKKFFLDHGVQVAGGMALSDGSIGGQFQSFCYTDPAGPRVHQKRGGIGRAAF